MAGLEEPDRALIEAWTGQLLAGSGFGSVEDAGMRLERLGVPQVVALEILQTRLGDLVHYATSAGSGDDRSDHAKNIKPTADRIAGLIAAIDSNPDLNLSTVAERVVATARAGSSSYTEIISVTAGRSRRAG